MNTNSNIKTEYEFDGRTYSILSRSYRNSAKVTFGDVLAIYCNQSMADGSIPAFILTHIAKRKEGKDPNRDAFLNMLVARNVLQKIKVSGENGYMIMQKPTTQDFQLAWSYSNELHDNGRKFEAYKGNDTLLAGAAQKSSRLMSLLVSELIKSSFEITNFNEKFSMDSFISRLTDIYTVPTATKIMNCLAINGAVELYYYEYDSTGGKWMERQIKFNRVPLYADDLQDYAKYESIPASCASHVHREKKEVKASIPYFDTYDELHKFYTDNIVYLIKAGKMPKEY